jgi:hypothetical protein
MPEHFGPASELRIVVSNKYFFCSSSYFPR